MDKKEYIATMPVTDEDRDCFNRICSILKENKMPIPTKYHVNADNMYCKWADRTSSICAKRVKGKWFYAF